MECHDIYVTIDDDILMPENWQHFIACAFDRVPNLGVCGIDYEGTLEGETLINVALIVPIRPVRDILFRDTTRVQNVAGGNMATPSHLAKTIGPSPYADDGRQYHADEDGWRSHQSAKRGYRHGYVTNPNGPVRMLSYNDSSDYLQKKSEDISRWRSDPVWR